MLYTQCIPPKPHAIKTKFEEGKEEASMQVMSVSHPIQNAVRRSSSRKRANPQV